MRVEGRRLEAAPGDPTFTKRQQQNTEETSAGSYSLGGERQVRSGERGT